MVIEQTMDKIIHRLKRLKRINNITDTIKRIKAIINLKETLMVIIIPAIIASKQ